MSSKFRKRKRNRNNKLPARFTLLIMTGVCFLTIFLSLTMNISGGPLQDAAGYVFVPMQKGINTLGNGISDKITEFRTLGKIKSENKKLKKQVEELTTQLTTNKLEQYELNNYRELFDLDAKYPTYQKIAASVIAKDSGNWFSTFTIDKGKKDVQVGDPVVTSYVSDRYQQGILVGYVTSVENNSNNLTKSGTITPVVDFEHIENVMVITQLKNTGSDDTQAAESTENSTQTTTE